MEAAALLKSENPFVSAAGAGDYGALAAAAVLNEERVRELIAITLAVERAENLPGELGEWIQAVRLGLGALLPPVNITIRLPLSGARSLSGRKGA